MSALLNYAALLFDDSEILATLEGAKSVFFAPIAPQPPAKEFELVVGPEGQTFSYARALKGMGHLTNSFEIPLTQGERFFIQEDFIIRKANNNAAKIIYRVGNTGLTGLVAWNAAPTMPALYSRLELAVTNIKAQRLNQVTEAQAIKHGVKPYVHGDDIALEVPEYNHLTPYRNGFINNWELQVGENSEFCWNANPFVWVVEFRRLNLN